MVRVLCVEDEPLVRAYVATRLGTEPGIEVVAEVPSVECALACLQHQDVDVVLLDFQLKERDSLSLLQDITGRGQADGPRVLFCTGWASRNFEKQVREAGAAGVVAKDRMAADLVPAIHAVAGGELWFEYAPADAEPVPPSQPRILVAEHERPT